VWRWAGERKSLRRAVQSRSRPSLGSDKVCAVRNVTQSTEGGGGHKAVTRPNDRKAIFDNRLLDIDAVACLIFNETFSAIITPLPGILQARDSHFDRGLVTMNGNKMPAKIVLPRKGPRTRAVRANMRLGTVGIMGSLVSLEVVSAGEGASALVALVLLARVIVTRRVERAYGRRDVRECMAGRVRTRSGV